MRRVQIYPPATQHSGEDRADLEEWLVAGWRYPVNQPVVVVKRCGFTDVSLGLGDQTTLKASETREQARDVFDPKTGSSMMTALLCLSVDVLKHTNQRAVLIMFKKDGSYGTIVRLLRATNCESENPDRPVPTQQSSQDSSEPRVPAMIYHKDIITSPTTGVHQPSTGAA
jgi:hypothetical protein